MADVQFGNVSADMRLTDASYGIAALDAFNAFIAGFVSVREEVLYATPSAASVREYDATGMSVTVTLQGNLEAHNVNSFALDGMGLAEEVAGSFSVLPDGRVYGTATDYRARLSNGDVIVRFAGVNVPFDNGVVTLPEDSVVLAGNDSIVTGAGQFYLLGYAGNDTLITSSGADTLDGGPGADAMVGGDGADTYYVDDTGDAAYESGHWNGMTWINDVDRVYSSVSYTLRDYVEQLVLTGSTALDGTGNALDNLLIGNGAANRLYGLAGADTFEPGSGNDTVEGGEGTDTVRFSGAAAGYLLATDEQLGRAQVAGTGALPDGIDTLSGIERLQFDGDTIGLRFPGKFAVNASAADWQMSPAVTALDDGGFLAAWRYTGAASDKVEMRRFSPGAEPLTTDVPLSEFVGFASQQDWPTLTRILDGSVVATWTSRYQDGSLAGVYGRHLDAAGAPIGGEFLVNTTTQGWQGESAVDALADGGYVVAWDSTQLDVYDVYARRFDATGQPVGGEFLVNSYVPWYQQTPTVAALRDGGFVVAWQSLADQGVHSGIYARRFAADGTPSGDEFPVNTDADVLKTKLHAAAAGLMDGGFVVAWESHAQDGDGFGLYAQRFDAQGGASGAEFLLNTTTAGGQTEVSLAALPSGGFFATWVSNRVGGGTSIMAQCFDALGQKVGAETLVSAVTDTDETAPAAVVLDDGRPVVVWQSHVFGLGDIAGRIFEPTGAPFTAAILTGNGAGNVVHADAGAQLLDGLGGNDLLTAGLDADRLAGGDGDDTLDGGAGDDVLCGNAGSDVLWGAAGADALYGGAGQDFLYGNGGSGLAGDLYDGGAGVDTAFFSGSPAPVQIDLLHGTGSGGDANEVRLVDIENVMGSSFDDVLIGSPADNLLDGGAGSDRLYGAQGGDVYGVDGQFDLVFELPDAGIDTVVSSASFYLYANVENLTLTGSAVYGVGNDLANSIIGDAQGNLLIGWGGNDTLDGGAANDVLFGVEGDDVLYGQAGVDFIAAGAGNDTVYGGSDADEAYGAEGNDVLSGGSDFATDILVGGSGNDTIDGGPAWDLMYGNAGDDTYYVSQQVDWTFELPGEGSDTVIADSPNGYYLYGNVENLLLAGSTSFGVGNELDNVLTGNAAANLLLGGAGGDRLDGRGGGDVLYGQAGADTFVFQRGTAGDVVADFTPGSDRIELAGVGYADYAALQPHMIEYGGSVAIDLGLGDFVVLQQVGLAQLQPGDFLFA